ncbi:Tn3 family transposase [Streptomyces europaeiscabiei]|uniref:Tn3 family transposase n=1 Tax=Streptomyces europaeiscabiei TaxID=146819 RepID=UPI0038D4CAE4
MRHCTDMEVDRQYTDTHGASIVGFASAHMLDGGFPGRSQDRGRGAEPGGAVAPGPGRLSGFLVRPRAQGGRTRNL